jgi:hypothetical protein
MPYFKENLEEIQKKNEEEKTEEQETEQDEETEEGIDTIQNLGTGILEIRNDIDVQWKQIVTDKDGGHVFQSNNGLLLFCNVVVKNDGLFKREVVRTWNITAVGA